MSLRKVWKTREVQLTDDVIRLCGGNKVLSTLLINRGINTQEKITNFLNPLKGKISDPYVFLDMKKSVERIKQAISNNENITVYGDFDSDGVTSTALLYSNHDFQLLYWANKNLHSQLFFSR